MGYVSFREGKPKKNKFSDSKPFLPKESNPVPRVVGMVDSKKLGGGFFPTHLKNMQPSNWIISPGIGVKIKDI